MKNFQRFLFCNKIKLNTALMIMNNDSARFFQINTRDPVTILILNLGIS